MSEQLAWEESDHAPDEPVSGEGVVAGNLEVVGELGEDIQDAAATVGAEAPTVVTNPDDEPVSDQDVVGRIMRRVLGVDQNIQDAAETLGTEAPTVVTPPDEAQRLTEQAIFLAGRRYTADEITAIIAEELKGQERK